MNKLPLPFQPEIFWKDIPIWLSYGENISRILLFMLIILMTFNVLTRKQKNAMFLYLVGVVLYFASWLVLIYWPDCRWSNSLLGFMAPAITPVLWLTGIGIMGNSFYFNIPYSCWMYFSSAFLFLIFHNCHTLTIYLRTH